MDRAGVPREDTASGSHSQKPAAPGPAAVFAALGRSAVCRPGETTESFNELYKTVRHSTYRFDFAKALMPVLPTDLDDTSKMFEMAPVSLWIEDYSAVRTLFEQWRAAGVSDIRPFLAGKPDRVRQCSERIRILKVNRKTLSLFGARDLAHLMANLGQVLRDDAFKGHIDEPAFPVTRSTTRWPANVSISSSTAPSFPGTNKAGIAS